MTNYNPAIKKDKHVPETSRRSFLRKTVIASTGLMTGAIAVYGSEEDSPDSGANPPDVHKCLDYGRSFLCNTAAFNSVRMWIESRIIITDTSSGKTTVYYQGASCKSENTFGEKDLFYKDNYDFLPVFGDGRVLVFRRHVQKKRDGYRSVKKMEEMWGANPVLRMPVAEVMTELDSLEKIRDATAAGIPIVTRTEFENRSTGLRAIIEAPCKTMNISHPKKMYQVDTGPIVFPDLTKRYQLQIDCLHLAFIAFNTGRFADFVIEAPTPVIENGEIVSTVYHYSKIKSLEAKNRIFALGKF